MTPLPSGQGAIGAAGVAAPGLRSELNAARPRPGGLRFSKAPAAPGSGM